VRPLSSITAEEVCAKLMPTAWQYHTEREKQRWLDEAQRYLDAIRALADLR